MLAKMNWRPCQNFQSMGDLHLFGPTTLYRFECASMVSPLMCFRVLVTRRVSEDEAS